MLQNTTREFSRSVLRKTVYDACGFPTQDVPNIVETGVTIGGGGVAHTTGRRVLVDYAAYRDDVNKERR